jgi:hypothetical protein
MSLDGIGPFVTADKHAQGPDRFVSAPTEPSPFTADDGERCLNGAEMVSADALELAPDKVVLGFVVAENDMNVLYQIWVSTSCTVI